MFTGWRSKRRLRRHVAIPEHHSLKRRAARMKKPRPTNDRGSACQTIWCRYAPRIAGSMAKFSAKRKGRQSFAPRFVYPPKVQIKQMRGNYFQRRASRATGCPRSGSAQARRRSGPTPRPGRPFRPPVSFCVPAGPWPPWARSQEAASFSKVPANRRKPLCSESTKPRP